MNDLSKLKNYWSENKVKFAVAESLTCGLLQDAFGQVSGVSKIFNGGVTVYSLEQKSSILGVDYNHAKSVNCVSEKVAREMVSAVCKLYSADIGIATTGYAEPNNEWYVDEPFAFVALSIHGEVSVIKVDATGMQRNQVRAHVCNEAINFCVRSVLALEP